MKHLKTYSLLLCCISLLLFVNCNNQEHSAESEEEISDTLSVKESNKKATAEEIIAENTPELDSEVRTPDAQATHKEIVKKYGEQWDFCTCIARSDSINNALMEASDEEFDAVMERSDYIDSKCKEMLTQPNETPEERLKHEKRVKKCLESAQKNS